MSSISPPAGTEMIDDLCEHQYAYNTSDYPVVRIWDGDEDTPKKIVQRGECVACGSMVLLDEKYARTAEPYWENERKAKLYILKDSLPDTT